MSDDKDIKGIYCDFKDSKSSVVDLSFTSLSCNHKRPVKPIELLGRVKNRKLLIDDYVADILNNNAKK